MLAKPEWHQGKDEPDDVAKAAVQPFVAAQPPVAHQLAHGRIVESDGQPDEEPGQQLARRGPQPIRNSLGEWRFG
ncbi:Uncharacterised protein [Mycobacterium tuberculosis]|nr:Uncharacterised protein [Mycobacterium tuberculosis]CKU71522.1 Uncharacterised protein [Mycobacterium tuberculosis]COX82211.1 Uncharacterised protein [Mycobacterium tuberculosis]